MATTIYKTVKASGGDYTTLAAWEAGQQADITAATGNDTIQDCTVFPIDDVAAVIILGWTTAAGNYIYVHADSTARHAGVWNGDKYNLVLANAQPLDIREDYVRIDGLQIATSSVNAVSQDVISFDGYTFTSGANEVWLSNLLIKGAGDVTYYQRGILNGTNLNLNIWNSEIYGIGAIASSRVITWSGTAGTLKISSTDGIGGELGLYRGAGTVTAKNTYFGGSSSADYSGTITKTTCASEDATGSAGLQGIALDTDTFVNVSAGTEDFHLAADGLSPLQGVGTDTSGDAAPMDFTTDIDGDARDATWDIGADAWVAAGTQTLYPDAIAGAEAFGTHQLNFTLYPSEIAGAEAFGTHQLNFTLYASEIATAEALGSPQLNFTVYPSAIAGAEAFGTAQLNFTLYPTAVGSSEAFGTLTITVAGQVKTYTGIFMFQNMNL